MTHSSFGFRTLMALWLACALAPPPLAQPEGTVRYEVVQQFGSTGLEDLDPDLRDRIPRELHYQSSLRFQGSTALFETQHVDPSGAVVAAVKVPVSFVDVSTGVQVQQRNVLDRLFLLERELEPIAWRLTGETGSFLGYEIHQAVADHGGKLVEAWFTPEIPASVGPEGYHGLPGLILLVTEDGGDRTITAQEVSLGPLAAAIAPPTEGRRIALEELERIREERQRSLLRALGAG